MVGPLSTEIIRPTQAHPYNREYDLDLFELDFKLKLKTSV